MTEAEWLGCSEPTRMLTFCQDRASPRQLRLFACGCCRRVWRLLLDDRSRQAVAAVERFADGLTSTDERRQARHAAVEAVRLYESWASNEIAASAAAAVVMAASAKDDPTDDLSWMDAAFLSELRERTCDPVSIADSTSYYCALAVAQATRSRQRDKSLGNLPWWGQWWQRVKWSFLDTDFQPYVSAAQREAQLALGELLAGERRAQAPLVRDILGHPFRPAPVLEPGWFSWRDGTVVALARSIYEHHRFQDLPILADALEEAGCTAAEVLGHCREPGTHVRGCWLVDALLAKGDARTDRRGPEILT